MTTNTTKKASKQILDVTVINLYDTNGIKAFKVDIKEGKFIVIDYKDRFGKTPDTEAYWESGTWPVAKHTSQYKAIEKAINSFLKQTY